MHVKTHSDKIFLDGTWERERELTSQLEAEFPNDLVELVDAVWPHDQANATRIVTDTVFLHPIQTPVIQLQPELWGYLFRFESPVLANHVPTKRLNCLMNRLSGERMQLFFELSRRGLVEQNYISFNCLDHNKRPSYQNRKDTFEKFFNELGWTHYQQEFDQWKDRVPVLLEGNDPDWAAIDSEVTIVSETYVSDSTVAFSEKIFRALQTPRPWLLNCSPDSVALLRDHGFDVLDDLIDHNQYDHLYDGRINAMLDSLDNIVFDQSRCNRAADHNYKKLHELKNQWPAKLKQVLTHAEK